MHRLTLPTPTPQWPSPAWGPFLDVPGACQVPLAPMAHRPAVSRLLPHADRLPHTRGWPHPEVFRGGDMEGVCSSIRDASVSAGFRAPHEMGPRLMSRQLQAHKALLPPRMITSGSQWDLGSRAHLALEGCSRSHLFETESFFPIKNNVNRINPFQIHK